MEKKYILFQRIQSIDRSYFLNFIWSYRTHSLTSPFVEEITAIFNPRKESIVWVNNLIRSSLQESYQCGYTELDLNLMEHRFNDRDSKIKIFRLMVDDNLRLIKTDPTVKDIGSILYNYLNIIYKDENLNNLFKFNNNIEFLRLVPEMIRIVESTIK